MEHRGDDDGQLCLLPSTVRDELGAVFDWKAGQGACNGLERPAVTVQCPLCDECLLPVSGSAQQHKRHQSEGATVCGGEDADHHGETQHFIHAFIHTASHMMTQGNLIDYVTHADVWRGKSVTAVSEYVSEKCGLFIAMIIRPET